MHLTDPEFGIHDNWRMFPSVLPIPGWLGGDVSFLWNMDFGPLTCPWSPGHSFIGSPNLSLLSVWCQLGADEVICPLLELPLGFTINHMFFQCCWHRGITRMFFHPHLAAESPCDVQLCSSMVAVPQGCPCSMASNTTTGWGLGIRTFRFTNH